MLYSFKDEFSGIPRSFSLDQIEQYAQGVTIPLLAPLKGREADILRWIVREFRVVDETNNTVEELESRIDELENEVDDLKYDLRYANGELDEYKKESEKLTDTLYDIRQRLNEVDI